MFSTKHFFLAILLLGICAQIHAQTTELYDARNNKTYKTIAIGKSVWMAENLAYADPIKNDTSLVLKMSGIYGFCYNDSVINCKKYGLLYNWEVAQKACPIGWHLPSKNEYDALLKMVGVNKINKYNALIKGGKSGFESLQVGALSTHNAIDGIFWGKHLNSFFWTTTEKLHQGQNTYAYIMGIRSFDRKSGTHPILKTYAVSVRCVKD